MSEVNSYKKLIVFQKADELAYDIYQATNFFPKDELYGVTSQMRRAATSVAANIAEGYVRSTIKDKLRYLVMARGSLVELEYFLDFTRRLGYIKKPKYDQVIELKNQVGKLLNGYIKAINNNVSQETGHKILETIS
jgi:four helix bundle protein